MLRAMHVALPISFIALICSHRTSCRFTTPSPSPPTVHWSLVPANASCRHSIKARVDIAPILPAVMPAYCQVIHDARPALVRYSNAPGTTSRQVLALYIPALSPIEMEMNIFPHLWGDFSLADKRRSEASARTHQLIHAVCGYQSDASCEIRDMSRVGLLARHMALFRYKLSRVAEQVTHGIVTMKQPSGVAPCVHAWVAAGAVAASAPLPSAADAQLLAAQVASSRLSPNPPVSSPVVTNQQAHHGQTSWGSSSWGGYNHNSNSSSWRRHY